MEVTFSDSGIRVAPIFGKVNRFVPAGDRLFRRDRVPVATLAFISDSADGRPEGTESFNAATKRVSAIDAVGSVVVAICWGAGILLSLVAPLFGGVRWGIRRLRKQPTPRAPVGIIWRFALFSAAMMCANLVLITVGSGDIRALGNASVLSVSAWAAGILFALSALAAGIVAFRRPATATRWQSMSLAVVRAVVMLNIIATVYLIYWRYIGWRTWV